jgi:hypothetical protein
MRILKTALVVLASLFITACGDKEVREYAKRLSALLDDYSKQLSARIKADTELYRELSGVYATETERDVYEPLRTERIARSFQASGDLIEGRKSPSQYMSWMQATAQAEQQRARDYFAGELASLNGSIAGLKNLQVDAAKADILKQSLDDLAQESGLSTKIQDAIGSATAFQNEYDLQACKSLENRLSIAGDSIAAIEDEKKSATTDDLKALNDKETALKKQQADWQTALQASKRYDQTAKKCK